MAVALTSGCDHGRGSDWAEAIRRTWAALQGHEPCLALEGWPGTNTSSLSILCLWDSMQAR